MSRVKGVVGNSIMIHVLDVVPGDILYVRGTENDAIIKEVQVNEEGLVRFVYDRRMKPDIPHTIWMDPEDGNGCVFVHDLKRERDLREIERL